MRKIGDGIRNAVEELAGDSESARVNMRIQQVRRRYRQAIESVYPPDTAFLHLAHTNSVIIVVDGGKKTLIVYVDDSLFAAELNAQRELIKLRLLELFGEEIADFQIKTSKWKKYRECHPFLEEDPGSSRNSNTERPSVPLNDDERSLVRRTAGVIEDERIQKALERAMTADLEWKKGENVETSDKNTK